VGAQLRTDRLELRTVRAEPNQGVVRITCDPDQIHGRKENPLQGPRLLRLLVLFLVLGLVAAACSSKKAESSGAGTMMIGPDKANNHGTKDFSGKDEAEVEQDNFYFEPTVLKGTAGQKIKLELDNEAKSTLHNFTLADQSIDMDVPAGQKVDVTVTFPQSGSLEFFCKYHKSSGMVGELSV